MPQRPWSARRVAEFLHPLVSGLGWRQSARKVGDEMSAITGPSIGQINGFASVRPLELADAFAIWRLIDPSSDQACCSSPYDWLTICRRFRRTGVVSERAGELLGCALARISPLRPETLSVHTLYVDPGVGDIREVFWELLSALTELPHCSGVTHLELCAGKSAWIHGGMAAVGSASESPGISRIITQNPATRVGESRAAG